MKLKATKKSPPRSPAKDSVERKVDPNYDSSPRLLHYRRLNLYGLWTLYQREVRRFFVVWVQTVATPAITALIFLAIFSLAFKRTEITVSGLPFTTFIMPGLVMMSIIQGAFANTSSSLLVSKLQGNIADLLLAPLSPAELTLGLVAGGATRGVIVGGLVVLTLLPFVEFSLPHPFIVLYNTFCAAVLMSVVGAITGLWAEKFEHVAALTSFVVVPLSFLSGTFYRIDSLPEPFHTLARLDPLFYLVDGLRYGFTDTAEGDLLTGSLILFATTALCYGVLWRLIARGYKIRK